MNNTEYEIKRLRDKNRRLQKEIGEQREGLRQLNMALNAILLSLVRSFGEENSEGQRQLQLPDIELDRNALVSACKNLHGYLLTEIKAEVLREEKGE